MADVSAALARSRAVQRAVFWTRRSEGHGAPEASPPTATMPGAGSRSSSLDPSAPGWDIWQYDTLPRREGPSGLLIRSLKHLYLLTLRPFHNELLRRPLGPSRRGRVSYC